MGDCSPRRVRACERSRRLGNRILQQTPQRPYAIFPADLLAFLVSPSPIADAYFVDSQPPLGHLYRDLRLESEAVFSDGNRLNNLPAEDLVAGLHVAQVDIGHAVRHQRQHPVAHRVPEVKHAVWPASQKPRAVDYVRLTLQQRFEQPRIIRGIIFEIGILNDHVVAGSFLNATAQCRTLPHIVRLQEDLDLGILRLEFPEDFARAIFRAIVHAHQFDFEAYLEDALDHHPKRIALVINGDDDRQFHVETSEPSLSEVGPNCSCQPAVRKAFPSRLPDPCLVPAISYPFSKLNIPARAWFGRPVASLYDPYFGSQAILSPCGGQCA